MAVTAGKQATIAPSNQNCDDAAINPLIPKRTITELTIQTAASAKMNTPLARDNVRLGGAIARADPRRIDGRRGIDVRWGAEP